MSRAKLAAAKELIEDGDSDAARAVLETMPDDSTAQKWLKRLPKQRTGMRLTGCVVWVMMLGIGFLLGFVASGGSSRSSIVASAPTEAAAETATPGPSATITETPTPTLTLTATETPTATLVPTATLTPVPLIFSGDGVGDQVIGPVEVAPGTYRAKATTNGFMIVRVDPVDGECGEGTRSILYPSLFNITRGDGSNGSEALFTSRKCSALISISNVQEPWTLEFEIIN